MALDKFEGKDIRELGKLFFEIGNSTLVPTLAQHILVAAEKFRELQAEDEISEMIIIADLEEKSFVFATGDGSDLESKEDDAVFYIAKSDQFIDCMELLDYIAFGKHPEGYLSLDSEVYHWIGDAVSKVEDKLNAAGAPLTIYGGYEYGETEIDPFLEI